MSAKKTSKPRAKAKPSRRGASGYNSIASGANYSTARGFLYIPTLDTRYDIGTMGRLELLRKARWFETNLGFAKRVVNGLANIVGYLTPKALTDDKEWNVLAEKNFEARAGSALACDLMGKHNFYSLQIAMTRNRLRDGDILIALTKTSSGGAAFMPYEAHQVDNGSDRDERWTDGVLTNGFGRHIAYSILSGSGTFTLPARDAIFYADFERLNRVRGITGFTHAINHLHDTTEILHDVKLGIKSGNLVGIYKTSPAAPTKPRSMGAGRQQIAPDPEKPENKVDLDQVYRGGKLLELYGGQELKTLHDSRPHPHQMSLIDFLIRDMSWGFGVSPEVLWFIGNVNGTNNRFMLADLAKWVEQENQRMTDIFCTRYWAYHCACEMKAGRLPPCKDPEWWKVGFIPQERLTVDRGRDGRLNIEMHRGGMLTLSDHWNVLGKDWKAQTDQWLDELKYIKDGLAAREIDLAELPLLLGSPNASGALGSSDDEPDPDPKKRKTEEEDVQ